MARAAVALLLLVACWVGLSLLLHARLERTQSPFSRTQTQTPPKFLFLILSASRPGADYVQNLTRLIQSETAGESWIVIYDADGKRPWLQTLGVDVIHSDATAAMPSLNLEPRLDKHHDPPERIQWRSKGSWDYSRAIQFAWEAHKQWPYAIVLEDDAWLADSLLQRLNEMVDRPEKDWLAWTLLHTPAFDTRAGYQHGDFFEFKACTQAVLYQSSQLRGLAEFFNRTWMQDPSDWIVRNYQYNTHAKIKVAIPSVAQHIGHISSLAAKKEISGCMAADWAGRGN